MSNFSPREIVSELDRFIIGQNDAKRAVAIALRNRWRRQQLTGTMREEVLPKNILMIGPTGVGKTEISRRLAKLAGAPFLKVEATKFTEVGYVGRDVDQIVRDLLEIGIAPGPRAEAQGSDGQGRARRRGARARPRSSAPRRARRPANPSASACATASSNDKEIEIEVRDTGAGMPAFEIPGMPGASVGVMNIGDMLGKAFGGRTKTRRVTVERFPRSPDQRGIRQAARRRASWSRRRSPRSRTTASSSSTRSTRSAPATAASAPTSAARACSATCCR